MTELGSGLHNAEQHEDALIVQEAELATERRIGAHASYLLLVQGNLAMTLESLGRLESALEIKRDVYTSRLKLNGKEHYDTIRESNNYASTLVDLKRFKEARSLMRKMVPVARRVLGENSLITLSMRINSARAVYDAPAATLDHLREAVTTLEDTEPIARRVLGGENPLTSSIVDDLQDARAALRARETPSPS